MVIAAGNRMMTIREGKWKYLDGHGSGGFSGRNSKKRKSEQKAAQLYDLQADLGETTNLFETHPEVVSRLKVKLNEIVESGRSR